MARPDVRLRTVVAALAMVQLVAGVPVVHAAQQKTIASFSKAALKRNYEAAAKSLEEAARGGDPDAMYRLAGLYRLGLGVPRDKARALSLLAESATKGDKRAAAVLARLSETIQPTSKTKSVQPAKTDATPPVDATGTDRNGLTWLARAAGRDQGAIVKALLGTLGHQGTGGALRQAALSTAVKSGAADSVRVLLSPEPGSPPDVEPKLDHQLLIAAEDGQSRIVEDILAAGADPRLVDKHGQSALHHAARNCQTPTMIVLARRLAETQPDSDGKTPLHIAASACDTAASIEPLITLQNINAKDNRGRTPLWYAAAMGNTDVVQHLIARGASVDATDDDLVSPLHLAAESANDALLQILVVNGADRLRKTRSGNTPLMLAAANDCAICVAKLPVPREAIDEKNGFGDTALILAVRARSPEIAQLLVAAGADPDARNKMRDTAMKIATRSGNASLVAALAEP